MTFPSALRPSRAELVDALVLWALTVIALFSFRSSYGGVEFLVLGGAAAAIGVLIALVAARLRWPFVVAAVVAALVYVTIGGAAALRDRAIAGFVPSPSSMLAATRMAAMGWKELITTRPPVGSTGDLMVLPVFAGLVAGFATCSLARRLRRPLPAVVVPALVLALGIATGLPEPVSVIVHGGVLLAATVAWLAWREHGRRPLLEGTRRHGRQLVLAGGMLAVAAACAVPAGRHLPLAGSHERAIWRATVTPPFDPRQYPSPLTSYRRYVKTPPKDKSGQPVPASEDTSQLPMFTIEGLPKDVPVRLASMDTFDGLVWKVSGGDPAHPSLNDSGSFERVGSELDPDVPGTEATVTITIGKYTDVWVPSVGEVRSLRFTGSAGGAARDRQLNDALRYNRSTDTAASPRLLREGDRYVMRVRLPAVLPNLAGQPLEPAVPHLGSATPYEKLVQQFAGPDLLAVGNDDGWRLDHVRDLFVKDGTYSDGDQDSGQLRARAGHGIERLAEFVGGYPKQPLIGNAEQYSSAFALLFRQVNNIPTRVVMGFLPAQESTNGPVTVIGRQVEAWVEVPVKDKGWVAVMPTPKRDQTAKTTAAPQEPEPDYRTQNPPPPPVLDPEFDRPATAAGKAKATKKDEQQQKEAASPTMSPLDSKVVIGAAVGVSPFAVFALVSLAIVGLKVRRRRRRRRRGDPHVRIASGWLEVTDLALDMGRPVPPTTTRREAAAFVGAETTALAARTDAAVWSGGALTDDAVEQYWQELAATLKAMRSELGPIARLRTAINVRSLRRHDRRRVDAPARRKP